MPYSGQLWGPNVVTADAADNEGALVWSAGGQSSAIALSTTTANSGIQSVRCTRNAGTGALAVNGTTEVPVAASTLYYITGAFFTNGTGLTVNLNVEWYTSGQVFISSTTTATISIPQNTWTPYPAVPVTTGATAAFLRINPQRVAGLTTGDFVYLDTWYVGRLLRPAAQNLAMAQPMRSAVW